MTLARLCMVPCIHVDELSDTHIRITADDGFSLVIRAVERAGLTRPFRFWAFENSPPSAVCHFHLRYLIHEALNG